MRVSTKLLVATIFAGTNLDAHDTWLWPARVRVAAGETVRLDMTSGMSFPGLDYAIDPARIAKAELRLAGELSKLSDAKRGAKSLVLAATLSRQGVAVIAVELEPKRLTLDEAHVAEYLAEIGASESIGPIWAREPKPRRWAETYRKQAKTFVRVGDSVADFSWREPLGLSLELVPGADPTRLRVGDALRVRLLKQGAPLPEVAIGAAHAALPQRRLVTTDASGWAVLRFDHAGPWMLAATQLRRRADKEWESDFATLTLEVGDESAP